jgi:hypothetical protein
LDKSTVEGIQREARAIRCWHCSWF